MSCLIGFFWNASDPAERELRVADILLLPCVADCAWLKMLCYCDWNLVFMLHFYTVTPLYHQTQQQHVKHERRQEIGCLQFQQHINKIDQSHLQCDSLCYNFTDIPSNRDAQVAVLYLRRIRNDSDERKTGTLMLKVLQIAIMIILYFTWFCWILPLRNWNLICICIWGSV